MASSSMTKNLNKTVKDSIKEDGIWIFSDTECKANKKVYYTWTTLFQAFQDKYFVVLLQNDASTKLSMRREVLTPFLKWERYIYRIPRWPLGYIWPLAFHIPKVTFDLSSSIITLSIWKITFVLYVNYIYINCICNLPTFS